MAADVVIRAQGLGKKYMIGHQAERERYVALRDVLARNLRGLARSAGDLVSGRAMVAGDEIEEFWALRDVDFEIRRGEVVGVVGRNGAGKSTLLKVLSRITEPTVGRVEIKGRVASLLEVGTGFHPELTGRENVYLNGAILGMSRAEIKRKFDEIVAFAEVEKFLDTPVKRYSSGMYVRLAFAVAAHLEPEILIVDEVLAVGDAEFQKKCLGKMGEVAGHGRTVLFVSHNMGALLNICDRGILLQGGRVQEAGDIGPVIGAYRRAHLEGAARLQPSVFQGPLKSVQIQSAIINGAPATGHHFVTPDEDIVIEVCGRSEKVQPGFRAGIGLSTREARIVTMHDDPADLPAGPFRTTFTIPRKLLRPGEYWLSAGGNRLAGVEWLWGDEIACIEVVPQWSATFDKLNDGVVNLTHGGVRAAPTVE